MQTLLMYPLMMLVILIGLNNALVRRRLDYWARMTPLTLAYWTAWLWWKLTTPYYLTVMWYWKRQARKAEKRLSQTLARIAILEASESGHAASSSPSPIVE